MASDAGGSIEVRAITTVNEGWWSEFASRRCGPFWPLAASTTILRAAGHSLLRPLQWRLAAARLAPQMPIAIIRRLRTLSRTLPRTVGHR